jgi:hypothetical protein
MTLDSIAGTVQVPSPRRGVLAAKAFGWSASHVGRCSAGGRLDVGAEFQQFVAVGVGAQSVDGADLALGFVPLVEDAARAAGRLQAAAERAGGVQPTKMIMSFSRSTELLQVVQDAAELARRARRDDHARAALAVDAPCSAARCSRTSRAQAEEILVADHALGLLVVVVAKSLWIG